MNFDSINTAREHAKAIRTADLIQAEVVAAKQIRRQTGCSWTEALKLAKAALEKP